MRALILHANEFQVNIVAPSTRPYGIVPETKKSASEEMAECLVVFFCVEKDDTERKLDMVRDEIIKAARDFGTKNLMIAPFVHLSSSPTDPETAKQFYSLILARFEETEYTVKTSHFGYHKSLLLDVKGHPGSFRYREF